MQGKQHQGRAEASVAEGRNPAGRRLLPGQIHQQAGDQGDQHGRLRGDRAGVQLEIQGPRAEARGDRIGHGGGRRREGQRYEGQRVGATQQASERTWKCHGDGHWVQGIRFADCSGRFGSRWPLACLALQAQH